MKRNELLAKSLTLGLAVATVATSMSVPGGLLAPETVYAEENDAEGVGGAENSEGEATDTTDTRTVLSEKNIGQYIGLGSSVMSVNSKAGTADGVNVHYLTQTGWSEEKYGKCVVKYCKAGGSEWINPNFQVGESYDVYVNVDGAGKELAAAEKPIKIGTATVYEDWESKDYYLQCKDGESGEPLVMDENYGTFDKETNDFKNQLINDAIILAPDGMKISTTVDGEYTSKVIIPREKLLGGSKGMDIFAKIDSQPQIYAKKVHVYFKLLNGDEKRISGSVELVGEAIIGRTLKASVTSDAKDTTYQYRFVREKDGKEEVAQAFGQSDSYTITKDDVGCTIKVIVTATTENIVGELVSDATAIVKKKVCDAPTFGENCFDEATRILTATVTNGITAAQLEYSLDGGNTWVNGNVENSILTVDGTSAALKLTAQAYNANAIRIRVAETDDTEASEEALYVNAIVRKGVNLAEAKVSLTDDNKTTFTYTGKPAFDAGSVTVVYGENKTLNANAYKVYYTDSKAAEAGTNTVAPTAVGDYKLWIVPAEGADEDCYGNKTVEFSIKAVEVTSENIATYIDFSTLKNATLTYGRDEKADELFDYVTVKDEYIKEIPEYELVFQKTTAPTEGTASQSDGYLDDISDAGTYKVFVKINAQNIQTPTPVEIGTVTIDKYQTKDSDIAVEGKTVTYNGQPAAAEVSSVWVGLDKSKVKLIYKKDGQEVASPTNVGTYEVYASYEGDNNCAAFTGTEKKAELIINKATDNTSFDALVVKAAADTAAQEYNLSEAVNKWTLSGTDTNVNAEVKVDDAYASYIEGLKYADGKVSFKLSDAGKALKEQKEFAIHVDFGESFTNYNVAFDIPVIITDKSPVSIEVNEKAALTYDGKEKSLTYKISGDDFKEISSATNDTENFTVTITKDGTKVFGIKDAGTYVVTAEYASDKNYGKLVREVTVAPKNVTDVKGLFTIASLDLKYDMKTDFFNQIIAAVKAKADAGVTDGDYTVWVEQTVDTADGYSLAGDATVSIEITGGNYRTNGKLQLKTVTIAKGTIALTVTASNKGEVTVKVGDKVIPNGNVTIEYYKGDDKLNAKPTAPGTYKVKVTYTDDKNLTAPATGEATFTISGSSSGSSSSGGSSSGSSSSGGSTSGGSSAGGGAANTPSKDDTKKDDTKKDTTTKTETKPDGTKVTTTETKAADGSVQTKIELKNDTVGVDATVNVAKDAQGKVTGVTADVNQTATDKQTAISAATVAQITEAAGTKDVEITMKTVDANGKIVREVTVNASDLTAGKKLKVVAVDPKTGEKTLVNKTTYKVAADGSLALNNLGNDSYEVVTTAEVNALTKEILQSIRPEKSKANLAVGKKTTLSLDDALNMDNVAKITYKTSKKSVATVNPNGTVTARKEGKVTIKAIVTLNNGKKKTVRMKLTVKARK